MVVRMHHLDAHVRSERGVSSSMNWWKRLSASINEAHFQSF